MHKRKNIFICIIIMMTLLLDTNFFIRLFGRNEPALQASAAVPRETVAQTEVAVPTPSDLLPTPTVSDSIETPEGIAPSPTPEASPVKIGSFYAVVITQDVRVRMEGKSMKPNKRITYDDLRYVKVLYYGYDDAVHEGELVVHKEIAFEVVQIFKELYEAKFPIERMQLIDDYGAVDEDSMMANNTSAFNYRLINNSNTLSNHAKGRAIDINPFYNPYVKGSYVEPSGAGKYTDRSLGEKGMIAKDSICVQIFKKYGWTWGGDWKTVKDYQHFEKE